MIQNQIQGLDQERPSLKMKGKLSICLCSICERMLLITQGQETSGKWAYLQSPADTPFICNEEIFDICNEESKNVYLLCKCPRRGNAARAWPGLGHPLALCEQLLCISETVSSAVKWKMKESLGGRPAKVLIYLSDTILLNAMMWVLFDVRSKSF